MGYNFSEQSTDELAAETRRRSSEVVNYTDAIWDTVFWAWLGSIPFVVAAVWALMAFLEGTWQDSRLWAFFIFSLVVWYLCARPWLEACKRIKEYTSEMKARTQELESRNRNP